jgi:hypothetical protein
MIIERSRSLPVFGNLRIMGPHQVIDQVTDPLGGLTEFIAPLRQHGNDGSKPGTRILRVTTELLDLAVDLQRAVLDMERRRAMSEMIEPGVVLPLPDSPASPGTSPSSILIDTSLTATTSVVTRPGDLVFS